MPTLLNVFHETEMEGTLLKLFYETSITLIPKLDKATKKIIHQFSLKNLNIKVLNKIPANQTQQHIKKCHTLQPIQFHLRNAGMVQHISIIKCNTAY
jgi:hypothetical protein